SRLKAIAKRQAETEAELRALGDRLEGQEFHLKSRAGAKDKLYGSITSADIAAELERAAGLVVDKRKVEMGEPIRQLGSHEVVIRLGKDITTRIKVTVSGEETAKGARSEAEVEADTQAEATAKAEATTVAEAEGTE
ncbi:MAG: 50S ribosomal protein L9, partial [Chloroflexota bacterium]